MLYTSADTQCMYNVIVSSWFSWFKNIVKWLLTILGLSCTSNDSVLYSEDEPEETFPASRVISSQILGYDGREVNSKERVKVTFPVNVSLWFMPAIIVTYKQINTYICINHMLWQWTKLVMMLCIHMLPYFHKVTIMHWNIVSIKIVSCRRNHKVSQYHQERWNNFAVFSLTI